MAQAKRASRQSNGGRQKFNLAHEKKRQAKFAAKREAGKAYEYKPNPYKEGSADWHRENAARAVKNVSKKLPMVQFRSIMAKLDNQLKAEKEALKKNGPRKVRREED